MGIDIVADLCGDEEDMSVIGMQIVEIAVRPERQYPNPVAGFGNGKKGGSVYAKLVPTEPWVVDVPVPAGETASLDGLAAVVKSLFNQMDTVLVLTNGNRSPTRDRNGGQEIIAR